MNSPNFLRATHVSQSQQTIKQRRRLATKKIDVRQGCGADRKETTNEKASSVISTKV
jgi:hypothetical protein